MEENKNLVEEVTVDTQVSEAPVEEKKNVFLDYLKGILFNIKSAFKYNPCLLAGLLICLPGIFIGFFLGIHSKVSFFVKANEADISGFAMFILVLMGCLNIFNGVNVINKRNLGSAITSTLTSAVITVVGVLWIQRIFYSKYLIDSGQKLLEDGKSYSFGSNEILSIVSVVLSILCSVIGCVLAYIMRNKNYKKETF